MGLRSAKAAVAPSACATTLRYPTRPTTPLHPLRPATASGTVQPWTCLDGIRALHALDPLEAPYRCRGRMPTDDGLVATRPALTGGLCALLHVLLQMGARLRYFRPHSARCLLLPASALSCLISGPYALSLLTAAAGRTPPGSWHHVWLPYGTCCVAVWCPYLPHAPCRLAAATATAASTPSVQCLMAVV